MFTKAERLISLRNLKPKKKEGFLKVISIFSFLGITLGVAILIIVMSVMNGFRDELLTRIIGMNGHASLYLNENAKSIDEINLKPDRIAELIKLIDENIHIRYLRTFLGRPVFVQRL